MPPLVFLAASVVGAVAVLAWRLRETRTPVTAAKLVAPPLGMSTGLGMFLFAPPTRVPWSWAAAAFLAGVLVFSWPLVLTSRLVRVGEAVMMEGSRAFFFVLIALAVVRLGLRHFVEQRLTLEQTAGIFFLLAFGMILRWRLGLLLQYRRLTA